MTEVDFMPVREIPVLTIPDTGVEEHGYELRFRIANLHGVIDVKGHHAKWYCIGRAEALSEAGLIDMAWRPGVPGNNKVSQTVVFSDGVAAPYRGNPRGRRDLGSYIRIIRIPGHRFEVEIPATPGQAERIKAVWTAKAPNKTPGEVRDYIHLLLRSFSGLADSYIGHAGFRIDPASARTFDQHVDFLHGVIQNARIERVPSEFTGEFTGNVVPFGPRR